MVFCEESHEFPSGEVAERLKAHAWKACLGETLTRVRIPLSPPSLLKGFRAILIERGIACLARPAQSENPCLNVQHGLL